jgi:thiamine-phosphate pyrophosphorylase
LILPQPPVLLITDRTQATAPVERVVAGALDGGCRWVLLRDKDMPAAERLALLRRLIDLGRSRGATVMVSADAAAAKQAGAAGVHLAAGGDPSAARRVLGAGALIGVSAHSLAEARSAQEQGADYVTLSPIFATASKPGYGPALGLEGLRAACSRLDIPVIALGGVGADTARPCLDAGAAGIAVMGEIMRAPKPEVATRALVSGLDAP